MPLGRIGGLIAHVEGVGVVHGAWRRILTATILACVVVAGAYGAATVSPRIFVVQAVPAILALGAVYAA